MNTNIMQLLQSLGIDAGGMQQIMRQLMQARQGMGRLAMADRGPPPGMGYRRPGFPGQGNAYGRMGMRPPQAPQAPQMPMAAPAATSAPTPPAPMPRNNFGQQMSQWAQSKPQRPDNYSGAFGQSPAMDTWRNARPTKPMKPMGM